jgi:hypothetical protein
MAPRTALFSRHQPGGVFTIDDLKEHPGAIYFVHSGSGTDAAGYGVSPDAPFASWAYAFSSDVLVAGDVVYLLPGHNESLGDAQVTLDISGVKTIGLGWGTNTPRVDFDHANASLDVAASSNQIKNIRLLPSVTAVLIGIDVMAGVTDTVLEDIEVLPGEDGAGVDEFALAIDLKAGCDRTKIIRPKIRQHASAAGVLAGIRLTGASDDILIEDPDIVAAGAGLVAPINGITTLSTNVDILRGRLTTDAEPGIEMLTGTTGRIIDTKIFGDLATIAAATVADGMAHFGVKYVEVGNESDAVVKTASADDV